ncbi:MAG TPA: complex I subunit 1 family protein, partial [bacterium]|nr:complex I subunit 1 family protein [bacterium]
ELGILYLLAVEALVVVGIVMSGWASNNKWSLLGGMRSAAQIVSYEVPVSLTVLMVVLWCGSLNIKEIILAQGAWPWQWHVFKTPFLFVAFFVFFIGSLAEGNRTPFDMAEAESELVSGYNTEYSGFRFILFFFAEFANLYLMGAISAILFLGGWNAGVVPEFVIKTLGVETPWLAWLIKNLIEHIVFQTKSLGLVFIIIQLRWTLPRVRIDQLMGLCWKYLVPIAFVNLVGMSLWMVFVTPKVTQWVAWGMTGLGGLIALHFIRRVAWHLRYTKAKLRWNPFV